ncbi:MAG: sigma-54 dependent transcriptional regulator [Verrucomicrobiota bacterium]|jgi:DNA-binding NtrC family response regulator
MKATDLKAVSILVVEDESLLRRQLAANLERFGAGVTMADSIAATRQRLRDGQFDFVLLDVNLPDGRGTDLLREEAFPPVTAVIVMTANGGVAGAVEAMRLGAADYLVKPFDAGELPLVIARAQRTRTSARLDEQQRNDTAKAAAVFFFGRALAGVEAQLKRILDADARMQTQLPPVLVQGETGTGKTTIARWLHQRGVRAGQPFVEVNCSALPDTLAESELFGHERGAFTDARTARIGLFEAASGGTLLLDELPSLSPALQAKVLKVIEDNRLRRLGGTRELAVDTRVIAATNQDCKELVASGKFREDLFHRLDLYRIQIPPLRERGDDVVRLAESLLENLCRRHRVPIKRLGDGGRRRLTSYAWPGNVRELSHELERAIVFEGGAELNLEQLQTPIDPNKTVPHTEWLNPSFCFPPEGFVLEDVVAVLIGRALRQTGNNVSAAARLLGVSRDFLRYRLGGSKETQDSSTGE